MRKHAYAWWEGGVRGSKNPFKSCAYVINERFLTKGLATKSKYHFLKSTQDTTEEERIKKLYF